MSDSIPFGINEREVYFEKVVPWVDGNASRFDLDPDLVTKVNNTYGPVATAGTYLFQKKKYDDSSAKRKDSLVTTQLQTVTDTLIESLYEVFDSIPDNEWTDADRDITGRKTGLEKTHVIPTTPIKEDCYYILKAAPNGYFTFEVFSAQDSARASKPESADALEIAYVVTESKVRLITGFEDRVQKTCKSPTDHTTSFISTKAKFELEIDPELKAFDLTFYLRWVKTKYPNLAGKWCGPFTAMIL